MSAARPTYDELAAFCRELYSAAGVVRDGLEHRVDHYTFDGSMNDVEDLGEALERAKGDARFASIVYPDSDDDDLPDAGEGEDE